ncbi:MAG: hypothetical protein ABIW19_08365 [Vicinamibacterales bacterium]
MPKRTPTKIKTDAGQGLAIQALGEDREYILESIASLEGECDQEALALIFRHGVLSSDPASVFAAVDRVKNQEPAQRLEAYFKKYSTEGEIFTGQARAAFLALKEITIDERMVSIDAAFMIGIAVGRRLGSAPLGVAQGGAR